MRHDLTASRSRADLITVDALSNWAGQRRGLPSGRPSAKRVAGSRPTLPHPNCFDILSPPPPCSTPCPTRPLRRIHRRPDSTTHVRIPYFATNMTSRSGPSPGQPRATPTQQPGQVPNFSRPFKVVEYVDSGYDRSFTAPSSQPSSSHSYASSSSATPSFTNRQAQGLPPPTVPPNFQPPHFPPVPPAPMAAVHPVGDDDFDERDSAYDSESLLGDDTVTLASYITDYRYENGRRYHAYRDGAYWVRSPSIALSDEFRTSHGPLANQALIEVNRDPTTNTLPN